MKMNKRRILRLGRLALTMIMAVALLGGCSTSASQDTKSEFLAAGTSTSSGYRTTESYSGDFEIDFSVQSKISYRKMDYLYWPYGSDHYDEMNVSVNQTVKAGDVLATFTTGVSDADILEAELAVTQAQSSLSSLTSSYQQQISRCRSQLGSLSGYEYNAVSLEISRLEAQYNSDCCAAVRSIEQAEQNLEELQQRRSSVTLTAPYDGVILSVTQDYRQGDSVNVNDPVVVIGDISSRAVLFTNSSLFGKVPYLSKVTLTDFRTDKQYAGTVVSCSSVTGDAEDNVVVEVDGELGEEDLIGAIRIDGVLLKKEKVVLVESAAVQTEGTSHYVLKLTDRGAVNKTYVDIGGKNGTVTWITEGVEPGETLILS